VIEYSDYAQLPGYTPSQDLFIEAAIGRIRNHCRWHISPVRTETKSVRVYGGNTLVLPTGRLTSVASIVAPGRTYVFETIPDEGVVLLKGRCTLEAVDVTFTHGHEECPPELLPVISSLAQATSSPRDPALNSVSVGSVTYGYGSGGSSGSLDAFSDVLSPYRLPPGVA
jgi:hypothetical protein